MLRVCVQSQLNSVSRLHVLDESFVDYAFRPMDEAISGVVSEMFGLSSMSNTDRRLVELPVRHGGLGILDILSPRLSGVWLASHFSMSGSIFAQSISIGLFFECCYRSGSFGSGFVPFCV